MLNLAATNAVSERSFGTLRRIKILLRATMHQQKSSSLMILNVHQDKTDDLNQGFFVQFPGNTNKGLAGILS